MMIVMTPGASEEQVEAVKDRLATTGVHVVVLPGELTTAIGAIGDPEGVRELGLEGMAGVDRVVPISRPYKLASSELYHEGPSVFDIGGRTVGSWWLSSLDASLYGREIGTTRSTPLMPSRPSSATPSGSPIAPIAVVSSPGMTTTWTPVVSRRSTTAWISGSVAWGVMTIITARAA
jgi:hypothetical protein